MKKNTDVRMVELSNLVLFLEEVRVLGFSEVGDLGGWFGVVRLTVRFRIVFICGRTSQV
jgi:hypothetical protein